MTTDHMTGYCITIADLLGPEDEIIDSKLGRLCTFDPLGRAVARVRVPLRAPEQREPVTVFATTDDAFATIDRWKGLYDSMQTTAYAVIRASDVLTDDMPRVSGRALD